MIFAKICTVVFCVAIIHTSSATGCREDEVRQQLETINQDYTEILRKKALTDWKVETVNERGILADSIQAEDENLSYIKKVSKILGPCSNTTLIDKDLERQLKRFPKPGYDALSTMDYDAMTEATLDMASIFQNVKLCSYRESSRCNLSLIPDIQNILHKTNDIEEIKFYWVKWRTATGQRNLKSFQTFVELYKKAAEANNFSKPSDMWYKDFDDNEILNEIQELIEKISPLFLQFHAHVRHLLQQKYGSELIKSNKPYPLYLSEILIGEVYRYQEDGHVDLPYPEKLLPNVTEELIRKGYAPKTMFDASRKFYESIGFPAIPDSFWDENARPVANAEEKVLTCFNQAWQTYEKYKVRYSYCPEVDLRRYLSTHEAMCNIYSYQYNQYQPTLYQSDSIPNFGEVLCEPLELSVQSKKYLERNGLVQIGAIDKETRINKLYLKGMETVFLLPILFLLDKYRIQILNGEIDVWDNCKYWKSTEQYIGAVPGVERTMDDFDAPAKLLTAVDSEYSSNVLSIIMQYQVFKSFCELAGEYIPGDPDHSLDNCDLSGHPEIGNLLSKAMALGSSKHWREILKILTGQERVDPSGYLEYFGPLMEWLIKDNTEKNLTVGWEETTICVDKSSGNVQNTENKL